METTTGGASDYRGPSNESSTLNQPQSMPTNQVRSYSQAAKLTPVTDIFPEREQAIVLSVVEDLKLVDYVSTVGKLIGPKNIIFASKISNNRICIYLAHTNLVDFVVSNHSITTINNKEVHIRRLITPAKRIIFSNVSPNIPHYLLETAIHNMGLKKVSPVTFLRASLPTEEFGHVLSFRRQIYVHPDDTNTLPSSIVINYKDMSYRIFLSYDELVCFVCKQAGHIANNCPNQIADTTANSKDTTTDDTSNITETHLPNDTVQDTIEDVIANSEYQAQNTSDETLISDFTRAEKRCAPSTSSLTSRCMSINEECTTELNDLEKFVKPSSDPPKNKYKKVKRSDSQDNIIPFADILLPAKTMISTANPPFDITFEQLVDFMENSHGSPDPLSISLLYTNNTPALLDMLTKIYPFITHRGTKSRLTKLRNKIYKQLNHEEQESEQGSEQGSVYSDNDTVSSQHSSY